VKSHTTETSIETQVSDYMADYDKRREESEKKKQELQQPDKDGWIIVTRKNPKPVQDKQYQQKKKKKVEFLSLSFERKQMPAYCRIASKV